MLRWRLNRHVRDETIAQIRAVLAEEQRLREELGLEPAITVALPDSASLDTDVPVSGQRSSRSRRARGPLSR